MNTRLIVSGWAALLIVIPCPCSAWWHAVSVSKEEAKEMVVEVRSEQGGPKVLGGPNHMRMEVDFNLMGKLAGASDVQLRIGDGEIPGVTASLRMRDDRSKPGHATVNFSADPDQLEKLTLWVWVPELDGGPIYEFRVKDLVELKKGG